MAIKIVTGVPGSGKSYYLMSLIVKNHFEFDKEYFQWKEKPRKDGKSVTIVTNIKGFKLPHVSLDSLPLSHGLPDLDSFLAIPMISGKTEDESIEESLIYKWCKKHEPVIFLIDEAQRRFPYQYKNNDVLFFFQFHRHLGVDLYLTSQDWNSLSPRITKLPEFEIRAIPKSKQLLNELRYKTYCGFDSVGSFTLKADKKIFALYKSFDFAEHGKTIRPVRKMVVIACLVLIGIFFSIKLFLGHFYGASMAKAKSPPRPNIEKSIKPVEDRRVPSGVREPPPGPANAPALLPEIETKAPTFAQVSLGGMWVGEKLVAIEWDRNLVPVQRWPWPILGKKSGERVTAMIPLEVLTQMTKPVVMLDRVERVEIGENSRGGAVPEAEGSGVDRVDLPGGQYYSKIK